MNSTVSEDTIVGTFKDSENRDGFMIVNYTDPALKKVDDVKFKFVNASRAMYYKNGEQKIVDIENGVFRESLQPGEGIFVIPL